MPTTYVSKKTIDDLIESVRMLTIEVTSMKERIAVNVESVLPVKPIEVRELDIPSVTTSSAGVQYPIPNEYRSLVDSILNKDFGIQVNAMSDTPAFQFIIIVPEKYSSMTPAYKEMYKADLRLKTISYAEGLNGVREWTEKVFNNFNPDMKAMIVANRVNG